MFGLQTSFGLETDLRASQKPCVGCLGFFITTDGLTAAFVTAVQLEAGAEVILKLTPFLGVEIIHEWDQLRLFEAIVTEELAHMRPVFLFAMGVAS